MRRRTDSKIVWFLKHLEDRFSSKSNGKVLLQQRRNNRNCIEPNWWNFENSSRRKFKCIRVNHPHHSDLQKFPLRSMFHRRCISRQSLLRARVRFVSQFRGGHPLDRIWTCIGRRSSACLPARKFRRGARDMRRTGAGLFLSAPHNDDPPAPSSLSKFPLQIDV